MWTVDQRIISNSINGKLTGSRIAVMYSQSLQSKLGLELILIFCSRFLVIKLVRSPSWLTVPSSSSADEMVARRPSDWPLLPPPHMFDRYLPPHAWLISSRLLLSCIPRTLRTQTWAIM
uniref:Uncharacterized protein n=1 Tax=Amphiprion ocellaris TaxID=80972 RepID=A0A3Q1BYM9_AMPOC